MGAQVAGGGALDYVLVHDDGRQELATFERFKEVIGDPSSRVVVLSATTRQPVVSHGVQGFERARALADGAR